MRSRPRPAFIGLLGTLLIVGVLFTVLKPFGKGADKNGTYSGPIASANQAVAQSQDAANKVQAATGSTTAGTTATPATPARIVIHAPAPTPKHAVVHHVAPAEPAIPGLAPGDLSGPILKALAHHHVAIVSFWKHGASDDDAVHKAVMAVSHHPGVVVFAIPISQVGKYPAITTGVNIQVSPTTLVIGPDHRFQQITGFTDAPSLNQAIGLARG